MALGDILRNAREQKGLTPSAVAESTHMKVQVIEDLEREDFKRIAAPIYGRGFVKLYAEFLQLDPEPLIRDFAELYAGARAPSVRVKPVEGSAEQSDAAPVTRTVTGAAGGPPQRQSVQARPAVRPLVAPLPESRSVARPAVAEVAAEPTAAAATEGAGEMQGPAEPAGLPVEQRASAFVVPDESEGDADELDLFRQQGGRRKPVVVEEDGDGAPAMTAASPKRRLPIFKVGGRLEGEVPAEELQDSEARVKRSARVQAFLSGVRSLRDGIERKLPSALPRQKVVVACCCGAAFVVLMASGIALLFKMTGANVGVKAGACVEAVAASPSLYVD